MGNKMPIAWHKEGLFNWGKSIEREEKELKVRIESLNVMKDKYGFYKKQIEEAEVQGKDSFDNDKFLVSRPKK